MENERLRINAPDVMHEAIDGEVIAINLVSGNYYSMRGSGADIWTLVSSSGSVSAREVVDALQPRFAVDSSDLAVHVDRFLEELRAEQLVVAAEPETTRPVLALAHDAERAPFEQPSLERYTDMQDLVLLDPVHQVDDTGWPRTKAEAEAHEAHSARRSA